MFDMTGTNGGFLTIMSHTLVAAPITLDRQWKSFINGRFEDGDKVRVLYDPASGKELCKVSEASQIQVERAIDAARMAFDEGAWPRMTALERSRLLHKLADKIEERAEELATLETLNAG